MNKGNPIHAGNNGVLSKTALVTSILALVFFENPVIGAALSIVGLVTGTLGMKSLSRKMSTIAITLSLIALTLSGYSSAHLVFHTNVKPVQIFSNSHAIGNN